MTILMISEGVQSRYVIGFSFSFIGLFVYGFQFLLHNSRVFYQKPIKHTIDLSDIHHKIKQDHLKEPSGVFVTQDGKLLF